MSLHNDFTFIFMLFLVEKKTVMSCEDFYRILKEEGLELNDKEKAKIYKLFANIKENTLPYQTVLKALVFSRYCDC